MIHSGRGWAGMGGRAWMGGCGCANQKQKALDLIPTPCMYRAVIELAYYQGARTGYTPNWRVWLGQIGVP